jgi:cysteine desulfurase family protein
MQQRIYLDNAATTWPKPEPVYAAVERALRELGAPAGRSAYREAAEVERLVESARLHVAQFVGAVEPWRIIFTANGTDSLNLAIHGILRPGDHVVTSVVEHNSVLRPLRELQESGRISVTHVPCDGQGIVDPDEIARAVVPATRLIVLTHASNVTGAIQPVAEVGGVAKQYGVFYLIDAAQSLGSLPVSVEQLGCSLLAAPGHKGLLGPLGTGILYIAPGVESQLRTVRQGGTGTQSEDDRQPGSLPDAYESGSPNVPGIVGLGAGVRWLQEAIAEGLAKREERLRATLIEGLRSINRVKVHGPANAERQTSVVSVTIDGYDPQEVASMLDAAYGIQLRSGLHCAPRMHASLGTLDRGGTARFSLGPFNTEVQIATSISAVAELATSAPVSESR